MALSNWVANDYYEKVVFCSLFSALSLHVTSEIMLAFSLSSSLKVMRVLQETRLTFLCCVREFPVDLS